MEEKESRIYEIAYLLDDELTDEKRSSFVEKIRNTIIEKGGLIIDEGVPKRQLLSYDIKKKNAAWLNWIKFSCRTESLQEIKKNFEKLPEILRFLVVKKTKAEEKTKPSIIKPQRLQAKKIAAQPKFAQTEEEPKIKDEEIDKKLEELLGK